MPTIRQLPPALVNKIAAGEVIERPASVVKELLENSVDAGARRVELAVEKGGLDLVRVSDDGCGISIDQLPLAVASHATSKLITADDLFDIHTLGFRGEALASIAEISHFEMRSRTRESDSGAILTVQGGELTDPVPAGLPVGTSISVRHLFFNTPVRRKFLKSAQTEMGHVVEAFTRIALAYPQVHMVLLSNDKTLYDLPPTDRWAERIAAFFGEEVSENLIHVESEVDDITLRGFVGDPSVSRSNNRMQYLFLNGRCIRDRALQHALGEAYRGLLMVGRFPVCFLRLDMPAKMVDVNVHPTKMEVRFQDGGRIYGQLLQTLRHKFLSTDLTAKVSRPAERSNEFSAANNSGLDELAGGSRSGSAAQSGTYGSQPTDYSYQPQPRLPFQEIPPFRPFGESRTLPTPQHGTASRSETSFLGQVDSSFGNPIPFPGSDRDPGISINPSSGPHLPPGAENWSGVIGYSESEVTQNEKIVRSDPPQTAPISHLGFQIHQRYLITQDEAGMVIIDQHALHERILYEQIRQKVLEGRLETQQLLVPEPVTLTPAEAAAALDAQDLLRKVGIHVEPFGGDTVLVTAYPAMLRKSRPAELLIQVLETWLGDGKQPEKRDLLDHVLHMIACKAAIKAGDPLASEEITELLQQRHHFQDSHHCPHGRPTALFFSREQLDRMFKRT
jgi:DNA mismatch repair protein MutL